MGLGFGEILIIVVVIMLVFGPQRIPELSRAIGRGMREFRKAMRDIETQLEETAAPLHDAADDLKREMDSTALPGQGQAAGDEPSGPQSKDGPTAG